MLIGRTEIPQSLYYLVLFLMTGRYWLQSLAPSGDAALSAEAGLAQVLSPIAQILGKILALIVCSFMASVQIAPSAPMTLSLQTSGKPWVRLPT